MFGPSKNQNLALDIIEGRRILKFEANFSFIKLFRAQDLKGCSTGIEKTYKRLSDVAMTLTIGALLASRAPSASV